MTAGIVSPALTAEQDQRIDQIVARERSRLAAFIRRRVLDAAEAEDLLQDVLAELVEAERLLHPIEDAAAWLYRVARNRITDAFRRRRPERGADLFATAADGEADEPPSWEELLPSPDAGPEAAYLRELLLEELEQALAELPAAQREVFIAHEFDGRSFRELAARSGVPLNTLLSRKHEAVLHLRRRLQAIHDQFESLPGD